MLSQKKERKGINLFFTTDEYKNHYCGLREYELTNHLGNVLTVVSDKKIPRDMNNDSQIENFEADIISATDYSPFGAPLYARTFSSSKYRYGFNGQEKDDEVANKGNINTAAFWEYDTRLGRRWNVDPKPNKSFNVYSVFDNDPILYIDLKGDKVVNGDRLAADQVKGAMDIGNKNLADFKSNHKIGDDTKRKDFLANGGTKQDWKEFKDLKTKAERITKEFNRRNERANNTQGIIDQWKISSPNLFNLVDKQSTDFILTNFDFDNSRDNAFGATTPSYDGDKENAKAPKSMDVRIAVQVNISSIDNETLQYSLNHEAGHFLYIVKYTAIYVQYYYESNANGTYVEGGHGEKDESGKVAEKFGKMKDIPAEAPVILPTGN